MRCIFGALFIFTLRKKSFIRIILFAYTHIKNKKICYYKEKIIKEGCFYGYEKFTYWDSKFTGNN